MTPGQAAFEKFIEIAQLFECKWEQLSDEGRAMWEQVADAAIAANYAAWGPDKCRNCH